MYARNNCPLSYIQLLNTGYYQYSFSFYYDIFKLNYRIENYRDFLISSRFICPTIIVYNVISTKNKTLSRFFKNKLRSKYMKFSAKEKRKIILIFCLVVCSFILYQWIAWFEVPFITYRIVPDHTLKQYLVSSIPIGLICLLGMILIVISLILFERNPKVAVKVGFWGVGSKFLVVMFSNVDVTARMFNTHLEYGFYLSLLSVVGMLMGYFLLRKQVQRNQPIENTEL